MKNFTAILFVFFLFSQSLFAQTPAERHQKLLSALENRDLTAAWTELQEIRQADKKAFEINNYDYLQGRLAEQRKDFATATASYQNVVKRDSVLREYALFHLSQIARAMSNLTMERLYLQELLTISSESLLGQAAQNRLLKSYFESGDYGSVINYQSNVINSFSPKVDAKTETSNTVQPTENTTQTANDKVQVVKDKEPNFKNPKVREILALVGQAYLRSGKQGEARDTFNKLVTNNANPAQPDDFALAGARGLDQLDSAQPADFGKIAPQLADPEHARRAYIYQFNRDFADARLHYSAIVERYPQSPNVPDALLQIGRSYNFENRPDEALISFEQILARFPEHPLAKDALSFKASALARMKRVSDSNNTYKIFIAKYIESDLTQDNAERPFLNIVDNDRDANKDDEALAFAAQIREKFKGKLPATLAQFAQARIYLARNDWQAALNQLENLRHESDLGGVRVPGGTNKSEVEFLYNYALEKLQRFDEAITGYLSIPDGRSEFYGWLATERLKSLATNPATQTMIEARLNLYRQTALQSLEKDAEHARQSAQNALRLTDKAEIRREMLELARKAYDKLPNYKQVPNANLLKFGRQNVLMEKPKIVSTENINKQISDELLFLGLYDEGTPELEKAEGTPKAEGGRQKDEGQTSNSTTESGQKATTGSVQNLKTKIQNPSDKQFTLAVFYKRGDLANRAIAQVEGFWRNVPGDYLIELAPREAIELMYPTPYADSLLQTMPERNVDARFMLSIMRQESRFNADIKSNAAARGLMQFITPTANDIARQLNKEKFDQNELYYPPTAILFGSQYLSNLFKMFPNQAPAVAASYNGGEFNMEKWLARSHSEEPDRYVSEIQFTQSKDYVYKVMANYRVYQILYDEKLKRR